jgi:hypothetical protein
MKTISRFTILLIVCATSLLNFSGCSLCGFGIGCLVDHYTSTNEDTLPPAAIIGVKKGDDVSIRTKNDYCYTGTFLRLDTAWTQDYSAEYSAARIKLAERDTLLPALGELVTFINYKQDRRMTVEFLGFDFGETIWINTLDGGFTRPWPLSRMLGLCDSTGTPYDTSAIRQLLKEGSVPFRTSLTMVVQKNTVTIPTTDIRQIEQDNPKYWKYGLAGVGLIFDIMIAHAVSSSSFSLAPGPY